MNSQGLYIPNILLEKKREIAPEKRGTAKAEMILRLPWWLRQLSICLKCGRPGFDPWVGKILWRRKWQPTPVLLPGKFHGRNLVGYSPWGCKELDTTE